MHQASRRTLTVYSPTTARARALRRGPILRELRTARRCPLALSHVRLLSYAKSGRISYARLLHPGGRGQAHFYELLFVEASDDLCLPLDQRSGRFAQFHTPEFGLPANRWLRIVDRNTNHNATLCLCGFLQYRCQVVRCLSSQSISLAVPCHTSLPHAFFWMATSSRFPRNITSSSWLTCSAPRAAGTRGAAPRWHVACLRDSRC
jgi:hypothetical protein